MCVLLSALIFTGCQTPVEPDTWKYVTSLAQINGTWTGKHTATKPVQELYEAMDGELDPLVEAMLKDMNVDITIKLTVTVNAAARTASGTADIVNVFSGGSTDLVWVFLSESLGEFASETPDLSIDNKNHSISYSTDIPSTPVSDEDAANFQINRSGKKIKVPADLMPPEAAIIDLSEMILTKK